MTPKVSIIMATYNRAHFIVEMLESIQAQSFKDWECLIIDDGGTDNTKEIIVPILSQDPRFKFFLRPENYKKGLPGSRNYGLDIASGEYVVFFDDDDVVHPDNLKICLEVIESNNVDFCHYQKQSFEKERPSFENKPTMIEKSLAKDNIEKVVTQVIGLASCTVVWKRKCFENIRFNENLLYAEEWEFYTRLLSENANGIIIQNILYYNRKHAASNTGEFYRNNTIRRESYAEAILLVVERLKEKQLLSSSLMRYFVTMSIDFKEFNLFEKIMKAFEISIIEKLKWQLFYVILPLRLVAYKLKKVITRKTN